jgi:hypothetical protein
MVAAVKKKIMKWWVLGGFVALLVLILSTMVACGGSSNSSSSNINPEVTITYSMKTISKVDVNPPALPNEGFEYLLVNLSIENKGVDSFKASPNSFFVEANNKICDSNEVTKKLDNPLKSVDLRDGNSIKGDLIFEVPKGSTEFNIKFSGFNGNMIKWVKQ